MEWFHMFIDRIYQLWFNKDIDLIKKEAIKIMTETNVDTGIRGEDFVIKKIKEKEYLPAKSPSSRTPADVWGINDYERFIHIGLVQVKASKSENPANLSNEDEKSCKEFCNFVFNKFRLLKVVPVEYQAKPLSVSIGYLGVKNIDKKPKVKLSYLIDSKNDSQDFELRKKISRICANFHSFPN